jgi:hypothetical protein
VGATTAWNVKELPVVDGLVPAVRETVVVVDEAAGFIVIARLHGGVLALPSEPVLKPGDCMAT